MLEDLPKMSDDVQWNIVCAFFHPESRREEREAFDLGSLFGGLFSDSSSMVGSGVGGSTTLGFSIPEPEDVCLDVPATIVFEAYGIHRREQYWRAEIALTEGLPIGDKVIVSVTDASGEKISSAKLMLLGSTLPVADGLAAYDLTLFQKNLTRTNVALVFPSGESVGGTLKFGFDENVVSNFL